MNEPTIAQSMRGLERRLVELGARADEPTVHPFAQAMWDALGILGFDLDGDPTPAASLGDPQRFIDQFLDHMREERRDHDEAAADAWDEAHDLLCDYSLAERGTSSPLHRSNPYRDGAE